MQDINWCYVEFSFKMAKRRADRTGLSTGYVGLSLGPQDLMGPQTNCGRLRIEYIAGI